MSSYEQKAVTFIEILIVLVIIAIVAAIATPQFYKGTIKARVAKAKYAISLISAAEKIYYNNLGYYSTGLDEAALKALSEVTGYNFKGISLDVDTDWAYSISGTAITAKKRAGAHAGKKVTFHMEKGTFVIDKELQ